MRRLSIKHLLLLCLPLMPLSVRGQTVAPHLDFIPSLTLDRAALDLTQRAVRMTVLNMATRIETQARALQFESPPPTQVRLWKVTADTFALEVGGGERLGLRPQFVAIGGGSGAAYAGGLRIGEVAIFQGYVDISDGMRFYGNHDFNIVDVRFNHDLHLVFVYREGVRAHVHEIAGVHGSLEQQVGLAIDLPTRRREGVPLEYLRLGAYGGGTVGLDLGGGERTRVLGGGAVTGGVQLIW